MNHSMNEDKSANSLSVSLSVNSDRELFYASRELAFDNDEHIYENVPKKRKSLSELMAKYAKKLKPKIVENRKNASSDKFHDDEEFLIDEMSSYTSCNEENIYENLDFNDTRCGQEIELENYSLKSWLHSLSMLVDDYEDENMMITKCIPGKLKKNSCCSDDDVTVTHAESELDKFKLDILKKCFSAIWKKESENEILSGLYLFLNDIFAMYFRKSRVIVKNEVNTRKDTYDTELCKSIDKKNTVQKLETFILSSTLNRLTITYNKSLKFYFALESSQFFGAATNSILNCCRLIVWRNRRIFEVRNKKDLKNFLATLNLVLENSLNERKQKAIKEIDDVESTSVIEENIYEPIWDCTNSVDRYESIYEFVEDKTIRDEEDWIIDAEFEFSYSPKHKILTEKENMYKTVQIIHRVNSDSTETISKLSENDATSLSSEMIQSKESFTDLAELNSVRAWKELLRSPFFNEDEEEFVRGNWSKLRYH